MTVKCHFCRSLALIGTVVFGWLSPVATVTAQRPSHPLYHSNLPAGALGAMQIGARRAQPGYVQPVRIKVPAGATTSIADSGGFQHESTDLQVGLTVGQPYRLRVASIPRHEEQMLYPSVELIDHLHPPAGQRDRFPIPIEITQDDLEMALAGHLVVRVIYVEDPARAFPAAASGEQLSTDVLGSEDPLQVADELGRPVAVVRLGSRVPVADSAVDADFVFQAPPVELLAGEPPQSIPSPPWEQEPAPLMMKTPLSTRDRVPGAAASPPSAPAGVPLPRSQSGTPAAPPQQPAASPSAQPDTSDASEDDLFGAPEPAPPAPATPDSEPTPDRTPTPDSASPPADEADAPPLDPFDVGEELPAGTDPFLDDAP